MDSLFRNIQYALGILWKRRAFIAVVIPTLAIGIGANAGVFSLLDAVMLRPLAIREFSQTGTSDLARQQSGSHSSPEM